jgi:hypothetical protein
VEEQKAEVQAEIEIEKIESEKPQQNDSRPV